MKRPAAGVFTLSFILLFNLPLMLYSYGTLANTQIRNGTDQGIVGQVDVAGDVVVTWTNGPAGGVTSNQVTVIVSTGYAVILSTTLALDQSLPPGSTAYIPYIVRNGGNANDTFSLQASTVAGQAWTVRIIRDDNMDNIHQENETFEVSMTSVLAPETSYYFFVAVTIPLNAVDGSSCTVRLTVKNQNGAGIEDNWPVAGNDTVSDDVIVICSGANLVVSKSTDIAYARPGSTITYTLTITNVGSGVAENVIIKDKIPNYCEYISGSIKVNNITKTDAQDTDEAYFDTSNDTVVVQVPAIGAGVTLVIEFKVRVK